MKRVLVIGSCGAGKSVFSRRLAERTGLKLIHLDKIYWKPNWIEPSKDEWPNTVKALLLDDSWIIDGNYGGTMEMRLEACDTVIFLDMPRLICVWRVLKRVMSYRNGARPDLAEGCNEKFDLSFIKWTWDYPNRSKPNVEKRLSRFEGTKNVIRLRSDKEVERFFTVQLESYYPPVKG